METPFGTYELKEGDEVVVFDDRSGFSVLSDYPEGRYSGIKMLIKIAISKKSAGAIAGSVSMVEPENKDGVGYPIVDDLKPDVRVSNFTFGIDEGVQFNESTRKFSYQNNLHTKTVTEFVDILSYNHQNLMPPSMFFERTLPRLYLSIIFWLIDLSYEKDAGISELLGEGVDKGQVNFTGKDPESEPFFKYVKISKNLLLASLITIILILYFVVRRYIPNIFTKNISSWFLAMVAVSALLFLEKIHALLVSQVKAFKNGEKNYMHFLHAKKFSWYGRSFDLIWRSR